MKTKPNLSCLLALAPALAFGLMSAPTWGQTPQNTPIVSQTLSPNQVLGVMKRVADWQLAHPNEQQYKTGWHMGVCYTGMMALYDVSKEQKYLDAMLEMGRGNEWKPGTRPYHADDHAVVQTYVDLYRIEKNAAMIAPSRERFDFILNNPKERPFTRTANNPQDRWSWCDALFMAPPAWARMAAATGDKRYLDFMDKEWWATTELLYDPAEKLYYRDWRFLDMKTPNGKKVFWSRGNGWVYAGLVRTLDYLPVNHPSRPKYLALYKDMTEAIVKAQQSDGLWRPSLLDPQEVPQGETSGTGLFLYGLAWGVNHGLLDKATYWPLIARGWNAISAKVEPDGKLTAVQGVGDRPKAFPETATQTYGTGAFLLAGSEIYKQLVGIVPSLGVPPIVVSVGQPAVTGAGAMKAPANTTAVASAPAMIAAPSTWARYVPERLDDFAWENDLVAFRAYGPAIKTTKGTEDSGIDCWFKSVPYPIIDKWYAGEKKGISYHVDHGEGYDPYHVGGSRGCGGLGIWKNGKLYTAGPYKTWKLISRETQKSVFELTYDYNVEGDAIHEVKRITIELGKRLFQAESTFTRNGKPAVLDIGIGITTHDGKATATLNQKQGWMACWEKIDANTLGTGVVMAPSRIREMREIKSAKADASHALLLTRSDGQGKVTYYAGFDWQGADKTITPEKWHAFLASFASQLR